METETSTIPSGLYRTEGTGGGSTLEINIAVDGHVTGFYRTIHGQPHPEDKFPLVGLAEKDLIGFVVSYGEHRSLTSWCGRYRLEDGRRCIRTVWHLARAYADKAHTIENDFWESFITYTGTYYKVG